MADLMTALRNADAAGDTDAANRIAGMIRNQQQPERSLGEQALGVAENVGAVVSGAIAEPLAGIAGVAQTLNPFADEGAGAKAVAATKEALTYQPQTETGIEQQQAIGEALQPVGEAISSAETALGETALDLTGSPFIASIAHSLPTAALEILGFKGSKALTKAPSAPTKKQIQKAVVESAPEIDAIKGAARTIYDEIDQSGVRIKPKSINNLVSTIEAKTRKSGLDPRVTKQAAGALDAIREMRGINQPITELMVQKNIAQKVATSADAGEKMLGNIMIEEIDSFLDSLSQKDLTRGDAATGKKVKAAGKLWGRAKRAEEITGAIKAGGDAASGLENGIRIELNKIIRSKKRSKYFSKPEIDAMRDVVRGDFKTNMAKLVGRFGFSEGRATNMLTSLGGVGLGSAAGGALGAIAIPAVGIAAKSIAQKLTSNKAKFVNSMTRAGTDANRITKAYLTSVPKAKRNPNDLAELLLDPKINLDDLDMIANETFKDALEIAKGKRVINLATAAAAGSTAQQQEPVQ
ncbi:MAG: hypothetical protein COA78_21140 [Blastopirellula sp.]|nr:MAG: hypothetical protein COA78_21140 [Blastopirellula sp.]